LLHPTLPSSKIVCSKVPSSINEGISFIVDLESLDDPDDVLADDMGVWKNNGVESTRVRVLFSATKLSIIGKEREKRQ
jgi:hypothetical protein